MGNIIAQRDIEKVFPADETSVIGIAGVAGLAIELVRLFQVELEHYEKIEGTLMSLEGKANQLSMMVRSNLPAAMQGMVVADPMGHLLAGFACIATLITLVYARPYAASRDMLKPGPTTTAPCSSAIACASRHINSGWTGSNAGTLPANAANTRPAPAIAPMRAASNTAPPMPLAPPITVRSP